MHKSMMSGDPYLEAMFKRTPDTQVDLFENFSAQLPARKSSMLDDPNAWHNVFLREVTSRVDEAVFEPLFNAGGRPNAPLRVLIGMMVLKEGNGWSDKQLFDHCRFDLRCMRALGQFNIEDDVPVESTYYELRRRLNEYQKEHGKDLAGAAFRTATQGQIETYDIKGSKIRMDSKLIQSNIAKSGRLELILNTIKKAISTLDLTVVSQLPEQDMQMLKDLREKNKTVTNITYPLDDAQKGALLIRAGYIIERLLPHCIGEQTLARLYQEHYQQVPIEQDQDEPGGPDQQKVALRPPGSIPANSLQSAHDPQAAYRRKGQQKVSGYHANITETYDPSNPFELLTDVHVDGADISEATFLQPAVENSNAVLGPQAVEHVTTDGGYDSIENREVMAQQGSPHWNMAKHKGTRQRYAISVDEHGQLQVYCTKTDAQCEHNMAKKGDKLIIHHKDGSKRYMTRKELEEYLLLQAHLSHQKQEDANIRPNVEATIHQVFHRLLKRDKMKYRGMFKCKLYVLSRAWWTNFRRILKNEVEKTASGLVAQLLRAISVLFEPNQVILPRSRSQKYTFQPIQLFAKSSLSPRNSNASVQNGQ